jgi:hypothetical protein
LLAVANEAFQGVSSTEGIARRASLVPRCAARPM